MLFNLDILHSEKIESVYYLLVEKSQKEYSFLRLLLLALSQNKVCISLDGRNALEVEIYVFQIQVKNLENIYKMVSVF